MDTSILANQFMIALVAWIGGLILGGIIGYLIAKLLYRLISSKPNNQRNIALVPWRTLVLILILFVWSPFIAIWLGLGTLTVIVMVGLTIGLVACFMSISILLDYWFPPILRVRLLAGARTLLFLAIFTTLGAGLVGGGGAGIYLWELMRSMEYEKLVQGILLLGGITLLLDLILGFVEFMSSYNTPSLPSM